MSGNSGHGGRRGPQNRTIAKSLKAVGAIDEASESKRQMLWVCDYLKDHLDDAAVVHRLIQNGRLKLYKGDVPDDNDKVVSSNTNKIAAMTVRIMRKVVLQGSDNTTNSQLLAKLMKTDKKFMESAHIDRREP